MAPHKRRGVAKAAKAAKKMIIPGETFSSNAAADVKVETVKSSVKPTHSKKSTKTSSRSGGLIRPTLEECRYATMALAKLHPYVVDNNCERRKTMLEACGMRNSITDSIISTMLSQNTTDANSKAAWSRLKDAFPEWEAVAECDDISKIEDTIRVAGLAKTRAERIQNMLKTVKKERGVTSLDYIRDFNDEQVKAELSRFKGLGPKTISCVLLFALGRNEFPVDTHVLRITQKMGWISSGSSREAAYEYLNEMVPNDVKLDLHCLLVRHGKCCHGCAARGRPQFPPEDGSKLDCPLATVSSWTGSVPADILKANLLKGESLPDNVKSECFPDNNCNTSKNEGK